MNSLLHLDSDENHHNLSASKPLECINILINQASDLSEEIVIPKSRTLEFFTEDERHCYLLLEGSMALHRRGDGIIMSSESAPFIYGLGNQLATRDGMYIRTLERCILRKISLKEMNDNIVSQDLWKHLARLLIYTSSRVYEHCARVQQLSAYDIIRFQLYELMNESDAFRQNITAANYIKERTYLARSGIMRILSELKAGNYIESKKGILININHLPKKY